MGASGGGGGQERGSDKGGDAPLSHSAIGNVLIAIFNGRKYLPHKEHATTQLLRECLGAVTCHAAMLAHVSAGPRHHTDTLATLQLAARLHRLRHLKARFTGLSGGSPGGGRLCSDGGGGGSTGSSDVDPSSSEQSADTVIYLGPAAGGRSGDADATDGEHPPAYSPAPASSGAPAASTATTTATAAPADTADPADRREHPHHHHHHHHHHHQHAATPEGGSPAHHRSATAPASPASAAPGTPTKSKSNKGSPARKRQTTQATQPTQTPSPSGGSPVRLRSDEQWVDGPRIPRWRLAEARSLLQRGRHGAPGVETWVDGPLQADVTTVTSPHHRRGSSRARHDDSAPQSPAKSRANKAHKASATAEASTGSPAKHRTPTGDAKESTADANTTSLKPRAEDVHRTPKRDKAADGAAADTRRTDENECCQILRNIYIKDGYNNSKAKLPHSPAKTCGDVRCNKSPAKAQVTQVVQPQKQELIIDTQTDRDLKSSREAVEATDAPPAKQEAVEATAGGGGREAAAGAEPGDGGASPASAEEDDSKDYCEVVTLQDSCLQVTEEEIDAASTPPPGAGRPRAASDFTAAADELFSKFADSLPLMPDLSRQCGGAPQRPFSVHGCQLPASASAPASACSSAASSSSSSASLAGGAFLSEPPSPPLPLPELLSQSQRSLDELARLRGSYDRQLRLGVGLGLGLGVYSDSNICDSCRGAIRPQPWYQQHSFFFSSSSISSLRHPDGASNPDLNVKEEVDRDDEEPPPELPPPLAPAASWRLWAQQRPPVLGEASAGAGVGAASQAAAGVGAAAAAAGGRVARVVPRTKATLDADAVSVLQYCREDVARLERRWTEVRASQVRELRQQQAGLRRELADAKARLLLPDNRWGYDLHVEESMDPRAPGFVEALQRETEILRKRVAACKSRVLMATCFDCRATTPRPLPLPPWARPPR